MGWLSERYSGEHEGYVMALVTREGTRGSGLYRALCSPNDHADVAIERLGAECSCGWRSPHWEPLCRAWTGTSGDSHTLEWAPFSPIVSPQDDACAYQEWRRHIADLEARGDRRDGPFPPLRVVPQPVSSPDDPARHLCVELDESRCWLKRRVDEDGQRVAAHPCEEYRTYCTAPGYCWCGHLQARHASHRKKTGRSTS